MAVTSIWAVKGRADQVVRYVCNPDKTAERGQDAQAALHTVAGVIEYAADEMKTERRTYVSGINCKEDDAAEQFIATKKYWQKTDGRACYHGYQSFAAGEVTAETAHEIGVRLAAELWGDRFEVLVATHCNTGHYHNHFVINSVSFADGGKFSNRRPDYLRLREVSDRLCREFAISVVDKPSGRAKHYSEWSAERNGKPTHRGSIRADIDRAILASTTERDFVRAMTELGYEIKTRGESGAPLKYPALRPPNAKGFFRFHKLGEEYVLERIKQRILENVRKRVPFPEDARKRRRVRWRGKFRPKRKITGLRALYLRYCYELHIIKKRTPVKRVSFLLREDLKQMNKYIAQTRLLGRIGANTIDELAAYRSKTEAEVERLTSERRVLRNTLRRLARSGDTAASEKVKTQISDLSRRLKALRRDIYLCDDIAERSEQVAQNMRLHLQQQQDETKERSYDVQFERRSRTGRADEP